MRPKRLTKRERENRACAAIIAGILRGWGQKEWERVPENGPNEKICTESKIILAPEPTWA